MTKPSVVFMFSGQGSQYFQMGRELYEQHPVFRRQLLDLNDAARDALGVSVVDRLYDDARKKSDIWDELALTHPAIYMVEVALARTLIEEGVVPDCVLGASLGVFAAAAIAGCVDTLTALVAVIRQAQTVEERCPPGTMLAILDRPQLHAEHPLLRGHSEIASLNFPRHFVVAAAREPATRIENALRGKNVSCEPLPVSRAFHSKHIDGAEAPYREFLRGLSPRPPDLPFACCVTAALRTDVPADYFWTVARQPVRFGDTIRALERDGNRRYLDLGPSGTLATFVKYNLSAARTTSKTLPVMTPFGADTRNLQKLTTGEALA
ncbi:MAG: acyltransferase domain-containing protein [Sulfurifustis sp.]